MWTVRYSLTGKPDEESDGQDKFEEQRWESGLWSVNTWNWCSFKKCWKYRMERWTASSSRSKVLWQSLITGLDYWTGLLYWPLTVLQTLLIIHIYKVKRFSRIWSKYTTATNSAAYTDNTVRDLCMAGVAARAWCITWLTCYIIYNLDFVICCLQLWTLVGYCTMLLAREKRNGPSQIRMAAVEQLCPASRRTRVLLCCLQTAAWAAFSLELSLTVIIIIFKYIIYHVYTSVAN